LRTDRIKWLFFLLIMVIPDMSAAQTRLFQPGDSGVIATLDFLLISEHYHNNTFGVVRGSYTHRGRWDVGLEYGNTDLKNDRRGFAFFGKVAVLNPQPGDRWGLEARLRFSDQKSETNLPPVRGFFIPDYDRVRYRNLIPGLRGFYRNEEASQVVGLGAFYRFRKYEVLTPADEVLIGYDYDELGFDFGVHGRIWGAMTLSVEMAYSQYKSTTGDRWELSTVWSVGVMFGRAADQGGKVHE